MAIYDATQILKGLADKKQEWAELSLTSKKQMIQEISARATDWGAAYDAGQQHMIARKYRPYKKGLAWSLRMGRQ